MTQTTLTKAQMTTIARKARRHGYYAVGTLGLEGYVQCPQCRERVEGYRQIDLTTGKRWTMTRALDTAMLAHLPYCGEDA